MGEDNKKYLIVGLGNAEDQYTGTRHNIGFEVVSHLAKSLNVTFSIDRLAYVARAKFKGRTLIIIMPTTFMNLSGKAFKYWMEHEKIAIENTLVISDDIDLPPGALRLRMKGGGGSHNGMNHIIETIGHENFPRLRFGIGKNYAQGYQVDYVLGRFDKTELSTIIEPALEKAVATIKNFVTIGIQKAMNIVNI
ncbi:MAG: aminoacyl-tRNA hydrolase [Bacteroidales bacterium]|jgi:PTH1 family peptidyl-tRNA hydrolase|nr:aminoacyl-tRNA hydrolase [Bacteroidales bacterium]